MIMLGKDFYQSAGIMCGLLIKSLRKGLMDVMEELSN